MNRKVKNTIVKIFLEASKDYKDINLDQALNNYNNVSEQYYMNTKKRNKNLEPWLSIFDESMILLNYVLFTIESRHSENKYKNDRYVPVISILYKILKDLNSVRLLIVSGYDSSSRILIRSILEGFETFVLICSDHKLNSDYKKSFEQYNIGEFYYKYLSKGKRRNLLNSIVDDINEKYPYDNLSLIDNDMYSNMSEFVHNSMLSSTHSLFVPSLKAIGMLEKSSFSTLSLISPSTLVNLYKLIINYVDCFLRLLFTHKIVFPFFDEKSENQYFYVLAIRYNVLSNILDSFLNELDSYNNTIAMFKNA